MIKGIRTLVTRFRRNDEAVAAVEFAMVLPETDAEEAAAVMRRLRSYATHPWSWGVILVEPDETVEAALHRADAAMYDDKRR